MSYIGKTKIGNTTHLVGSTLYGTCDTAAGTAAKVATLADFDELITGVTVHIKFTYSNTAANPTLNINSTGAKNIYRYGTTAPSTSAKTSWQAGSVISFTYDGSYWQMNDWLNDDSTYTVNDGKLTINDGTNLGVEFSANQSGNSTLSIKGTAPITATGTSGVITIAHSTAAGYNHIPSGGSSGQFLGWNSAGTAKWVNNPNTTYTYFLANTGGTDKATSNITNPYLILRDGSSNQEVRLVGSTNISVIGNNNASTFSLISHALTNQDLDSASYRTLGFHYAGGSNTVTNKPSGIDAFGLSVYQTASGWFTQEIIEANTNSGRRWQRYYNGSSWTAWIPLPTFTTTPTSGQVVITDGTTGGIKSSGYTIATSVPSGAVFTDTKVTAVGNHYAPTADSNSQISVDASSTTAATWNTTSLVTGVNIQRDAKGHVTGVTLDSIKMPANPNTDTKVTQNNTTANSEYRVLLSHSANDTNETNIAYKSGNLTFTPLYYTLNINGSNSVRTSIGSSGISIGLNATSGRLSIHNFSIESRNDVYNETTSPFMHVYYNEDDAEDIISIGRNVLLNKPGESSDTNYYDNLVIINSALELRKRLRTLDGFNNDIRFTIDNQKIHLGNSKSGKGPNYLEMSHSHVYLHSDNITSINGKHTTLIGADYLRTYKDGPYNYGGFTSQLTLVGSSIDILATSHYRIDSVNMYIHNSKVMDISTDTFNLGTDDDFEVDVSATINIFSNKTVIHNNDSFRVVTDGGLNSSSGFFIGNRNRSTNGMYVNGNSISLRSQISLLRIKSDISIETNKFKIYSTPRHKAHTGTDSDYEQISFYVDANTASMVLSKHAMSRQFVPPSNTLLNSSIKTSTVSGTSSIAVGDNINVTGAYSMGIGHGSYDRSFEEPDIVPNGVITKITDSTKMTPVTSKMNGYCEFIIPISDEDKAYLYNRFGYKPFYILIDNSNIHPDSLVGEHDIRNLYNYCKYCRAMIFANTLVIIKVSIPDNVSSSNTPYKLLNDVADKTVEDAKKLYIWTTPDEFLITGNNSVGIGTDIKAYYDNQLVIGVNNTPSDCPFIISANTTGNIFQVDWSGNVYVNGEIESLDKLTTGKELIVGGEIATTSGTGYNASNPKISFRNQAYNQGLQLIFTDYDTVAPPQSLTLVGSENGAFFITPNIRISGAVHNNILSCTTAAATAAKTVANTQFRLTTGATVYIKFTNGSTVASPTLNINRTGAKAIYYRGEALSDNYPLLANKIYELIYNGTQYEILGELELGTIKEFTKSLTLTTDWVDTGIAGNNLESGSYIVQVSGISSTGTSMWSEIFTGVCSWFDSGTNSSDSDEIILHQAGHASGTHCIYLRTLRKASGGTLQLQISANFTYNTATNVTFKFRRLI